MFVIGKFHRIVLLCGKLGGNARACVNGSF